MSGVTDRPAGAAGRRAGELVAGATDPRGAPARRMPGEFEPHARTVMCWPARHSLYGELFADAERAHAATATAVAEFEPVTMIAAPGAAERAVAACGAGVDVVELAIDDSWFRDSGPIYVHDAGTAASSATGDGVLALDWVFNAWGEKFRPFADDATIARRYAAHTGQPTQRVDVVLEGGAITVDGAGTLVTTEQCLLHPNRNPSMTRRAIEGVLGDELGVERVVWLPFGLALDDDTDGHVDNVAAFAAPGHLLVQGCDDPGEDDWLRMNVNRRCAADALDARGIAIGVVEVPVLPFTEIDGRRVPVPYLNFYVVNGGVIVPTCGHPADGEMLALIGEQFPGRRVVGVDVGAVLAYGGGGIHCITKEIPAAR